MRFEPIDHADTAALRRLYDLYEATRRADDPDGPHCTYDYFRGMVTYGHSGDPGEIWIAEDGSAGTWFELPARDNTHTVTTDLFVHPRHRRRGIGRELVAHIAGRARDHGRRVLITEAENSSPGAAFARKTGAEPAVESLRQFLDIADVPDDLPKEAGGYELARWEGPCPAELRPGMARLRATMNDAPTGDLDWEDEAWDAARVEAGDRVYTLRNIRAYTVIARHAVSGEPAGYTEIQVDGDGPWATQEDTAVTRPHRGHRLGLVLKSVMLDWLRDREPAVRQVVTWNATSNTHMRAVNERLGFREKDRWCDWQLRL
jgi:GNAT superfamily N-acetyltransferase